VKLYQRRDVNETLSSTLEVVLRQVRVPIPQSKILQREYRKRELAVERGKRDVYCDKQIGKAVTALNCMLKGSWGEVGSGGIRKKLKSEYTAYLESKYRRNDGSSI